MSGASPKIGIIDYGAGNIRSVVNALKRLDASYIVSSDQKELDRVDKLILPGVGEAKSAIDSLYKVGLVSWLKETHVPFLGICLGMQILFDRSTERATDCLGIISGEIEHFGVHSQNLKIPQIGWNQVDILKENPLFTNIRSGEFFYFVHSYRAPLVPETIGWTEYGSPFTSAVRKNNFYGVQFHPEKSSHAGLRMLKNFIELC
jgi:glutamine amidotransferase